MVKCGNMVYDTLLTSAQKEPKPGKGGEGVHLWWLSRCCNAWNGLTVKGWLTLGIGVGVGVGGGSLQRRSFRTLEPGICQNEKKKNGWWTTVSKTKNLDGEFLPAEFIAGFSGSWIMSREIAAWSNGSWITDGKISPDPMDLVPCAD